MRYYRLRLDYYNVHTRYLIQLLEDEDVFRKVGRWERHTHKDALNENLPS